MEVEAFAQWNGRSSRAPVGEHYRCAAFWSSASSFSFSSCTALKPKPSLSPSPRCSSCAQSSRTCTPSAAWAVVTGEATVVVTFQL
ncbi:hypothetical protein NL676_032098 [Syzygium grande]|nr:hypothetical protein NL676_032098 [Syzygium grande]